MKKIVVLLIVFSINYCWSQINYGEVTYKKENLNSILKTDRGLKLKKNKPKLYENMKIAEMEAKLILEELRFKLIFKDNKSIFKTQELLELEDNKFYMFALGPRGSMLYFNDLEKKERFSKVNSYGMNFLIKEKMIKWKLTGITKKILKYTCYKATTVVESKGRKGFINYPVTAWFCPKLSFPFGPLGYSGLPGLILELEVSNEKYIANKVELDFKKDFFIKKPKSQNEISREKFDSISINTMNEFKKSIGK